MCLAMTILVLATFLKDLARKLNISDAKLSLIMNGKQKPDVDFLKAVHTQLHVDAEFILQHV